jgi:hypothetical protein
MILWDTKKRGGRPDSMQLLKDTWTSFGAEVIFITSNKQGNDEMMQGCRAGTSTNTQMIMFLVADSSNSRFACLWHSVGLLRILVLLSLPTTKHLGTVLEYGGWRDSIGSSRRWNTKHGTLEHISIYIMERWRELQHVLAYHGYLGIALNRNHITPSF